MRRHPTCGRKISNEDVFAKAPPGTVIVRSPDEPMRILGSAIPPILRSFGCDEAPHPTLPGGKIFRCQICGPRMKGTTCEADKHDAYYAAVENGEREPIEWEGDVRKS